MAASAVTAQRQRKGGSNKQPAGKLHAVQSIPFLAALSQACRQELAPQLREHEAGKGAVLAEEGTQGEDLLAILEGTVELSKGLLDGRRQTVGFRFPGDVVTVGRRGADWPVTVRAITASCVSRIPIEALTGLSRRFPEISDALLDLAAEEITRDLEHLLTVGRKRSDERLATFLLEMARRGPRKGRGKATLELAMTRPEMAAYLGLTTETVCRTFTKFRAKKLLALPSSKRVEVLNWAALEALAHGAPLITG